MAKYVAVYHFPPERGGLFLNKLVPVDPRPLLLPETEYEKAWVRAMQLINEANDAGANINVDKIELYELVSEQTYEKNQRGSGKRKQIPESVEKTQAVPTLIPQIQPA